MMAPAQSRFRKQKPGQLTLNRVSLALAVFIKRPQAEKIKSAQH
jgi:hypothetical protein